MAKNKKNYIGKLLLILGTVFLLASLLINRYIEISDSICLSFMVISLMVELFGFYKIIKDTYN